jgi:hypothetical protein
MDGFHIGKPHRQFEKVLSHTVKQVMHGIRDKFAHVFLFGASQAIGLVVEREFREICGASVMQK